MTERRRARLGCLALLVCMLAPSLRGTGILFGTMHVTAFTPNLNTAKYSLKNDFRPYLLSMYNDQQDQNVKEFRLPVEVHVHRKQHADGSWMVENYVALPFPIYYDHMRVMKLTRSRCHANAETPELVDPLGGDMSGDIDVGTKVDYVEDQNSITPNESRFLKNRLTDVYTLARNIRKSKRHLNNIQKNKNCQRAVIEPEGFVFLFDNPDSEGMMKIHSRREPERVVPRHNLFYHLNQGLQLYFSTNEDNDLVDRFDEGDLTGNQFGAILHTTKFPRLGHFSANFFVDRVERFDLDSDAQNTLTGNKLQQDEDQQADDGVDVSGDLQGDLATQFHNFKQEHVMENGIEFEEGFSGEDGFQMFKDYLSIDHFKGNF